MSEGGLAESMSLEQAYRAMFYYLQDYYFREHSDEIGNMLGGMALLSDGGTADAAAWEDWLIAVKRSETDLDSIFLRSRLAGE